MKKIYITLLLMIAVPAFVFIADYVNYGKVNAEDRNIDSTFHPLSFRQNRSTYLNRVTVKDSDTDGTGSNWVSEPIYIGKSSLLTLWLKTFNNSGNTVAKVQYDFSNSWDRAGSPSNIKYDWAGTQSVDEAMGTENNTVAYSIKPVDAEGNEKLGLYIRFLLSGGIGNGSFDAELDLITK